MNEDNTIEAPAVQPRSVVRHAYKARYAERAKTARGRKGVEKAVVAQTCGDWLALELEARFRPSRKAPFDYDGFTALLDANGVGHAHLSRSTPGWQGRLRMTGRLALQTIVAETGVLVDADGGETKAPRAWCEKVAR